jgi:hypothetical protein
MLPPELARPIDDLMKADLQVWRDGCFVWLLISTVVVGIGILCEGPEVWHQTIGVIRALERHTPPWIPLLASFGWLLIAAGVIGEGITEAMVSTADGNLQTFNDIVLAEAQTESAFALERAAHAEATARGFDAQIAESDAKAKSAEATAKKFESQIAEAQRLAAESAKEAESERLERIKLEAAVAPRRLSLDQQRRIADACRKFRGHLVMLESYSPDGESFSLGEQILASFRAAGIIVADSRAGMTVTGGFDFGVHVRGPESERGFASTLVDALSSIGNLKVFPVNDPGPKIGSMSLGGGQEIARNSVES